MVVAFLSIPGVPGSARQQHVREQIAIAGVVAETVVVSEWTSAKPNTLIAYKATSTRKVETRHKAMVLTKQIDFSSPILYGMMKAGEKIDGVALAFWRLPAGGGGEQNFFTMKLDGVQVAGVRLLMPNNKMPGNELFPEQEELLLTYTTVDYVFDTTPRQLPGGGSGGTDPVEKGSSGPIDVVFDPPNEVIAKDLAIDSGKWAAAEAAKPLHEIFQKTIGVKKDAEAKPQTPAK